MFVNDNIQRLISDYRDLKLTWTAPNETTEGVEIVTLGSKEVLSVIQNSITTTNHFIKAEITEHKGQAKLSVTFPKGKPKLVRSGEVDQKAEAAEKGGNQLCNKKDYDKLNEMDSRHEGFFEKEYFQHLFHRLKRNEEFRVKPEVKERFIKLLAENGAVLYVKDFVVKLRHINWDPIAKEYIIPFEPDDREKIYLRLSPDDLKKLIDEKAPKYSRDLSPSVKRDFDNGNLVKEFNALANDKKIRFIEHVFPEAKEERLIIPERDFKNITIKTEIDPEGKERIVANFKILEPVFVNRVQVSELKFDYKKELLVNDYLAILEAIKKSEGEKKESHSKKT